MPQITIDDKHPYIQAVIKLIEVTINKINDGINTPEEMFHVLDYGYGEIERIVINGGV